MQTALASLNGEMVSQGAYFVTAFLPVLGLVAGIGLAMWVLVFARDYFRGE